MSGPQIQRFNYRVHPVILHKTPCKHTIFFKNKQFPTTSAQQRHQVEAARYRAFSEELIRVCVFDILQIPSTAPPLLTIGLYFYRHILFFKRYTHCLLCRVPDHWSFTGQHACVHGTLHDSSAVQVSDKRGNSQQCLTMHKISVASEEWGAAICDEIDWLI